MAFTRITNPSASSLGIVIVLALATFACASGSGGGVGDDYQETPDAKVDAPNSTPVDAPIGSIDARIDAPVSTIDAIIDAPVLPDGGPTLFCASTADCASTPGTCCFPPGGMGFCIPGTEPIPGFCIPG